MRVCFISHSSKLGGAEKVLLETIDALKGKGVDCRVILPDDGQFARELMEQGIPYAVVRQSSWVSWGKPSLWRRLKTVIKVVASIGPTVKAIRDWRCDLIYSNTITICVGALAAAITKLPHVWHLHEFGKEDHGIVFQFGDPLSYRMLRSLSSMCVVVSYALAQKYARYIEPAKLSMIYPSMHRVGGSESLIEPSQEHILQDKPVFRCAVVGGLVKGKRQEDAIQACASLRRSNIEVELLIIGHGDPKYRRYLEEIVRTNGLEACVVFVGRVNNAFPFVQRSDALLVCSRCEAFGRVTVEGMLAGKPVIGARAGATPELVREGFNGLLYACGRPEELAEKIKFLYQNPQIAARLGRNGREWASRKFTIERYGIEMMTLLSSLTSEKPSSSHARPLARVGAQY